MTATALPAQRHPRLKPNVDVFRHVYRGDTWYVFHDRARERFVRVSAAGGEILAAMDGSRPLLKVIEDFRARRPDLKLDGPQLQTFLRQLDGMGLIASGGSRLGAIERQRELERRRSILAYIKSPISLKIPLLDPEPVLRRLGWATPWLFGRVAFLLWLALVLAGAACAAVKWHELTGSFTERALSLENLAVAGAVYPAIKVVHESMHALALRHFGCEVRRIGIIIMALLPIPYVDASSSMTLADKRARMLIAAAGILAELFLFGVGTMVWALTEPVTLHTICYNIAVLTGLSTVLFNGNPLQRYDGYYIMCDLVEIPDLGSRAARHIAALSRRWLLADRSVRPPPARLDERRWFLAYGIASAAYRTLLLLTIALYVADSIPFVGAALALWTLGYAMLSPLLGAFKTLRAAPPADARRGALRLGLLVCAASALLLLPLPSAVVTEGYVLLPDDAQVRPRSAGTLQRLAVEPGQTVSSGDVITTLVNDEIETRLERARASMREMEATYMQAVATSRASAGIAQERLDQSRKELADAEAEHDGLVVRAGVGGAVLMPAAQDLPGRYFGRGDVIAMVRPIGPQTLRATVPQWQIDQVRRSTQGVGVRSAFDPQARLEARILRVVPAASDVIPSPTLSLEGGGSYAVVRRDAEGAHAPEVLFWVDLELAQPMPVDYFNGKVYVRFDLGTEAAGLQLLRSARLVFLRHFHA